MFRISVMALALATAFSSNVFAADEDKSEGQSTIKIEDATDKKNAVDGNLDEEITNKKLRAETGSKSKYSASLTATYNGSSLEKPGDAKRPNLYNISGQEATSSMNGDISARYRMTKNNSITLGLGVGFVTPLQGDIDKNSNQLKVNNPSIGFNRAFQAAGVQNSWAVGVDVGTSKVARAEKMAASPSASYTLIKGFSNGLSLGLAASGAYVFYKSAAGDSQFRRSGYGNDKRTEYEFGLFPFLEYELTDKLSFRTVSRYTTWYHPYGETTGALLKEVGTQSAGIGISVMRDVYLYPNVQFLWQDMASNKTNVALNATINIF